MLQRLNETARTLLEAADIIRERGLAKCTLKDDEGRVCVHGAINIAMTGSYCYWSSDHIWMAVRAYLESRGEYFYDIYPSLVDWNNRPERTQEEVIAALEGAAWASA